MISWLVVGGGKHVASQWVQVKVGDVRCRLELKANGGKCDFLPAVTLNVRWSDRKTMRRLFKLAFFKGHKYFAFVPFKRYVFVCAVQYAAIRGVMPTHYVLLCSVFEFINQVVYHSYTKNETKQWCLLLLLRLTHWMLLRNMEANTQAERITQKTQNCNYATYRDSKPSLDSRGKLDCKQYIQWGQVWPNLLVSWWLFL